VQKYASLGSAKINPLDRLRLPRKEILEIQGKLRCHQTHLISYLEMIGVSALGRVEQKFDIVGKAHEEVMERFEVAGKSHEEVMGGLDAILRIVDQIGAEIRAGMHTESLFSDHTDDDKEVWKTLRSKLIQQGFTSKFIQPHEGRIIERVKEMNDLGLLDSDAQVSSDDSGFETEVPFIPYTKLNTSYLPAAVVTDVESGYESEATLPPRPSKHDLRRTNSNSTIKVPKRASVSTVGKTNSDQRDSSVRPFHDNATSANKITKSDSLRRTSGSISQANAIETRAGSDHRRSRDYQESSTSLPDMTSRRPSENYNSVKERQRSFASLPLNDRSTPRQPSPTISNRSRSGTQTTSPANMRIPPQKMRVWTGKDSRLKLKAEFIHRSGDYIHLREGDGGETIILATNLSLPDQEYIDSFTSEVPEPEYPSTPPPAYPRNATPQANFPPPPFQQPQQAMNIEPETIVIEQEKPETFIGKRSRWKPMWIHRKIKTIPYRATGYDCDALPLAASKGQYKEVQKLLAKGADIESDGELVTSTDSEGNTSTYHTRTTTALYRSAMAGYFDIAKLLLDNGADVETNDLLHKLASKGASSLTRLLLEYGAEPSHVVGANRRTALHVAAHKGYLNIVDALLEYGATIDASDKAGETPLYLACMEARLKIVQHLLREGADTSIPAQDGQTALYKAGGRGYADVTRALLSYSADASCGRGVSGETVLFKAARKGYDDVVHELLRYGADANLANDSRPDTKAPTLDIMVRLLRHSDGAGGGGDDEKNTHGCYPLHATAEGGHVDIARDLLAHGAVSDVRRPSGETPLYAAARMKHRDVADVLMRAGAQLAPQEEVDDVLRLMNSGASSSGGGGGADSRVEATKKKRVQMISELVGRFSGERFSRGVESWRRGETVQGIDLVTEALKRMSDGRGEGLNRVLLG
jgi:ankyrin repeat protein